MGNKIISQELKTRNNLLIWVGIIGILFCLFLGIKGCVYSYIIMPRNKSKIKGDPILINNARIYKINFVSKASDLYVVYYKFTYNGREFFSENKKGFGFKSHGVQILRERGMPVIFEKSNPKNSILLLLKKDFNFFNIQIPDSLLWIEKEVIK